MTRVLHVIDLLTVGGAQKMLSIFAGQAIERGIEMSVVSLADISGSLAARQLQEMGISVRAFPAGHLSDLRRIAALVRYVRASSFDLIHSHLSYGNILGSLAGRLAGVPTIGTLHSAGDDQSPQPAKRFTSARGRAETFALRYLADRVMAVGDNVALSQSGRFHGKDITVVPNAVPVPPRISAAQRLALRSQVLDDQDQALLISVGRFAPVKEIPDLIEAFRLVRARCGGARLVLVGDGQERSYVEDLVRALGLCAEVILLGRRADATDWLQAGDIYVSASSLEGLPLSVLEAMAVSLPVVATGVGDLPRLISPEAGILVPPHQPERLAEAVCSVITDPQRRLAMGSAAFAYFSQNFDVSAWSDRILAMYASVLEAKGSRLTLHGEGQ